MNPNRPQPDWRTTLDRFLLEARAKGWLEENPLVVCACSAVWEEDACESEAERRFMYSTLTLHDGDVVEVRDCPACEPYEWSGPTN